MSAVPLVEELATLHVLHTEVVGLVLGVVVQPRLQTEQNLSVICPLRLEDFSLVVAARASAGSSVGVVGSCQLYTSDLLQALPDQEQLEWGLFVHQNDCVIIVRFFHRSFLQQSGYHSDGVRRFF